VCKIHCDQTRLDFDDTLRRLEKLNQAQRWMDINVEASDAEAAIEVRKNKGLIYGGHD